MLAWVVLGTPVTQAQSGAETTAPVPVPAVSPGNASGGGPHEGSSSTAQSVPGPDVALAEQLAQEAFEAYQAGRHIDAVALYRRAYRAAPSAAMLYNLARIYDVGLRDGPLAVDFYRQYIADPGAEPDRLVTANERLLALRAAESAERAEREGAEAQGPAAAPAPRPSSPPSPPGDTLSGLQIGGMAVAAAGLVGLGVGARYGLVAKDDADSAREVCDGNACRSQAGVDAAHSARDNALLSTVGFAVGAGLLTVGIVMWIVGDEPSPEAAVASAAVRLTPVLSPQGSGLMLHGAMQ